MSPTGTGKNIWNAADQSKNASNVTHTTSVLYHWLMSRLSSLTIHNVFGSTPAVIRLISSNNNIPGYFKERIGLTKIFRMYSPWQVRLISIPRLVLRWEKRFLFPSRKVTDQQHASW